MPHETPYQACSKCMGGSVALLKESWVFIRLGRDLLCHSVTIDHVFKDSFRASTLLTRLLHKGIGFLVSRDRIKLKEIKLKYILNPN